MPKSDILAGSLMLLSIGLGYFLGGFIGASIALILGGALLFVYYFMWRSEGGDEFLHVVDPNSTHTEETYPLAPAIPADQQTLKALTKLLSNHGGIMQLRNQPFQSRFLWNADEILLSFQQLDTGPDHGFLDKQLEGLRQQLHEAIALLLDRVHRYSDLSGGTSDQQFRVFWRMGDENIATYDARRNEVFEAAKSVCDIYDDLVLTARRRFET
jgi:hypothetical protein